MQLDAKKAMSGDIKIRAALIAYVSTQKKGGWSALRPGPDLKEGATGPRVADLRHRLEITGHLAPSNGAAEVFDATVAESVRRFQRQNNLSQSGVVDRRTLLALNIPVRDRVAQLTANLERWRWFEDPPAGEQWVINTNAARLDIRQADGKQEQIALKVDNACEQSPALDSSIELAEVAPAFTIPANFAARYVLPVLQKQPQALDPSLVLHADTSLSGVQTVDWKSYSETNFPFSVVQSPGRSNLLGLFRITLKDDAAISIHGRPWPEPKLSIPRNLWPACVAVSGPPEKIQALLQRIGIEVPGSSAELTPTQSRRVSVSAPIPVIVLYETVWLDADGSVVFGPDPLGLDADLARKLIPFPSS